MDELTIGDKTYISSKQAAKITGYAKDYVGQLCREGRVEARLVGRNWYVLESSIREHRFGIEVVEDSQGSSVAPEKQETKPYAWTAPVYVSEEPVSVPTLAPKEPEVVASRKIVSEMQTAWQEWFTQQSVHTAPSPDEVPETLPEAPAVFQDEAEMDSVAVPDREDAQEEVVPLQVHIDAAPQEHSYAAMHEVMDLSRHAVASEPAKNMVMEDVETEGVYVDTARQGNGASITHIILVAIILLSVCAALIGTGVVGDLILGHSKNSAVLEAAKYLGGETEYKNSK